MSGILVKELIYAKAGKKMLFLVGGEIVFLLFLTFSKLMTVPAELASYIGMLMGLIAAVETFNTIAVDEKSKWDTYARSLPATVFDIVGAKYLSMLIFSAFGTVLGVFFYLLSFGLHMNGYTLFLLCAISFAVPILACCVALPLFYRFGYQKTNLFFILLICIWPLALSGRRELTEAQLIFTLKLSPVLLLAVFVVSFFISCAIYSRKEF